MEDVSKLDAVDLPGSRAFINMIEGAALARDVMKVGVWYRYEANMTTGESTLTELADQTDVIIRS